MGTAIRHLLLVVEKLLEQGVCSCSITLRGELSHAELICPGCWVHPVLEEVIEYLSHAEDAMVVAKNRQYLV